MKEVQLNEQEPIVKGVYPEGVLEVAKLLELALKQEAPFQAEVEEGVHKEVSREKFLEHSISNAAEALNDYITVEATTADESHPLRDDVFQLDLLQTVLRAEVDTLKDIQMEFSRIREDMDNMKLDDPDLPVHVGEWRHYIRLLDTLLVHVVKELGGYSEIASDSVNRLFKVLIQDKKA